MAQGGATVTTLGIWAWWALANASCAILARLRGSLRGEGRHPRLTSILNLNRKPRVSDVHRPAIHTPQNFEPYHERNKQ
jgi:hypothetical protein